MGAAAEGRREAAHAVGRCGVGLVDARDAAADRCVGDEDDVFDEVGGQDAPEERPFESEGRKDDAAEPGGGDQVTEEEGTGRGVTGAPEAVDVEPTAVECRNDGGGWRGRHRVSRYWPTGWKRTTCTPVRVST